MYFFKSFFSEDGNPIEVELICDKCGKVLTFTDMSLFDKVRDIYCVMAPNAEIKCTCGNQNKIDFIEPKKEINVIKINNSAPSNIPKCPTCGSPNLKKISATSKAVNTIAFGLLGTKRHKTFHCNNCGYEW